jgi:hypothetical protein
VSRSAGKSRSSWKPAALPRWHASPVAGRQAARSHKGNDEEEMEFQNAKRVINFIYGHSDSESSNNEHRKQHHIIYDGSWDITSRRVIKTLC